LAVLKKKIRNGLFFLRNQISMVLTFEFDLIFISEIPCYSIQDSGICFRGVVNDPSPKIGRSFLLKYHVLSSNVMKELITFFFSPLRYLCTTVVLNYAMF
jgi:hypothetical protein